LTEKEFISGWTKKIGKEGIKKFPDDFIVNKDLEEIELPGKTLILGEEFFGSYEILTIDGNPFLQLKSHTKAKYIIYSNRLKPKTIKIPLSEFEINSAVSNYEDYLDSILKEIKQDYTKNFPDGKNSIASANEIFKILNLTRY
jgi:hypothetical protein